MMLKQEETLDQICANCHAACGPFQLYCRQCGWILPQALTADADAYLYATRRVDGHPAEYHGDLQWGTSYFHHDAKLFLKLPNLESLIPVPMKTTPIVIGRRGGSAIPHVDLMPYGGFDLGVSRYHVRIDRDGYTLKIADLESNNGTILNNVRLEPKIPYVLHNHAILQLGSLVLRVLFA